MDIVTMEDNLEILLKPLAAVLPSTSDRGLRTDFDDAPPKLLTSIFRCSGILDHAMDTLSLSPFEEIERNFELYDGFFSFLYKLASHDATIKLLLEQRDEECGYKSVYMISWAEGSWADHGTGMPVSYSSLGPPAHQDPHLKDEVLASFHYMEIRVGPKPSRHLNEMFTTLVKTCNILANYATADSLASWNPDRYLVKFDGDRIRVRSFIGNSRTTPEWAEECRALTGRTFTDVGDDPIWQEGDQEMTDNGDQCQNDTETTTVNAHVDHSSDTDSTLDSGTVCGDSQ